MRGVKGANSRQDQSSPALGSRANSGVQRPQARICVDCSGTEARGLLCRGVVLVDCPTNRDSGTRAGSQTNGQKQKEDDAGPNRDPVQKAKKEVAQAHSGIMGLRARLSDITKMLILLWFHCGTEEGVNLAFPVHRPSPE